MKIVLVVVLSLLLPLEAFAAAGGCAQKIVEKCKSKGREIGGTGDMSVAGMGAGEGGTMLSGAAGERGRKMGEAAGQCAASASECDKCPPAEKEQCKQQVGQAAGEMKEQSAAMGDASAALGAIAGLAGAMLPMLMKKDEEEEEQLQQDPNAARQCNKNGQCIVYCDKNDSYRYAECDTQLAASCMNAMSDGRCVNFANRYCNSTGVGSPYCNRALAYQFCSRTDANGNRPAGIDQCPTCAWLAKTSSAGCTQSPAECLQQPSAEAIESQRPYCPNDPIFVGIGNAGFGGVAGTGTGAGGTAPTDPNLPPPILPAGGTNGGTGGSTGTGGGNAGGGGGGGPVVVTQSAVGGRDALRNNPLGSASTGGGGGGGYSTSSTTGASGGRDTASAAGGGYATASASGSGGPVSDVNGEFGPSLFATASQVIRNRCVAGRFYHCP